jgi:hypothetical protein
MPISMARNFPCLRKRKAPSIGIKTFELCEASSGYVYDLEVYIGAHPTNSEHNTVLIVDMLCNKMEWTLRLNG